MIVDWTTVRVVAGHGGRVRCEPNWRLDRQWSQRLTDFDLWLVWQGRGVMQTRDQRVELRPGVYLWMRPGGLYLAEQDPDQRLGVSYLHFDLLDHAGRRYAGPLPPMRRQVDAVALAAGELARIRRWVDQGRQNVADALLQGLLMDWDAELVQAPPSAAGRLAALHRQAVLGVAQRLADDPGAKESIQSLAESAGYCPDHFARLFRQVVGLTPQAYRLQRRIERARQLLTETTLSIAQIAAALGYRDVYFFSRQFKRKTGHPPSALRQDSPSVSALEGMRTGL